MTFVLFDSVDPAAFPDPAKVPFDATAGYVNGRWPSSAGIRKRFPNLPHLSITVNAAGDADCLDIEPSDATPADAPAWLDRQYARGLNKPTIYCGNGDIAEVRRLCGSRPFWWWSANWTRKAHIDPGADATQWDDKGPNGEGVDQSQISDAFFAHLQGDRMALTEADADLLLNRKFKKQPGNVDETSLRINAEWEDNQFTSLGKKLDALTAAIKAMPVPPTAAEIAKAVLDEDHRRSES